MIKNKKYKLKLGTIRVPVWLREIVTVLDASELSTDSNRRQIERHDVAECVLETLRPIAFDLNKDIAHTGRFVIIDNYEIAGGGVILEKVNPETDMITEHVERREKSWERSSITPAMRAAKYKQRSTLILITGSAGKGKKQIAKALEEELFEEGRLVYYLGLSNSLLGIDADISLSEGRDECIRRLGEISHMFTDAGMFLITTISDLEDYELDVINALNKPNDFRLINIGKSPVNGSKVDLQLDGSVEVAQSVAEIKQSLKDQRYLIEYYL